MTGMSSETVVQRVGISFSTSATIPSNAKPMTGPWNKEGCRVARIEGNDCRLTATVKNGHIEILGDAAGLKALGEICLALGAMTSSDLASGKECGHYEFDDVYFNVEEGSASFTIRLVG